MPQLISHRDGFGWQTPNIADIVIRPPQEDLQTQHLRGLATILVRKFAELGTPVRLKDMDRYTSHTRYHLIPDKVGGRGQEREVTLEDLQNGLPQVLPHLNGTQAAELIMLHPDEPTISLLIRTAKHKPISLRELLEQKPFIDASTYTCFPLGVDLAHKAIVLDLSTLKHFMIVGQSNARLHLQLDIALTLMMFNSPSYLRIALVGDDTNAFKNLLGSPHILGNIVKNVSGFRRLIEGLQKHISQRRAILKKQSVTTLEDYNKQAISNQALKPLPRIVMLLDTVVLQGWVPQQEEWLVPFHQLLVRGAEVGVHVVMTSATFEQNPERLQHEFPQRVVLRSALASHPSIQEQLPPLTPLNFIDGVWWANDQLLPVEMGAVTEAELARLTTYWKNMQNRRNTDLQDKGEPVATGNTGLLTLRADLLPTATLALNALDPRDLTNGEQAPLITDRTINAARALAAYLGWLSLGPLQDVLHLTGMEATETINILRAIGTLEEGEGPVWRFARLADPPSPES